MTRRSPREAPARPRKPVGYHVQRTGFFPRLFVAMAAALGTMAVVLGIGSVIGGNVVAGSAGPGLARLLALALLASALFFALLAALTAGSGLTSRPPFGAVLVGVALGGLEAALLLIPVPLPFLLVPWPAAVLAGIEGPRR